MMTQEKFMDVRAMKHAGMTFVEIGEQTGSHSLTIAKWWRDGGPPPGSHGRRRGPCDRPGVGGSVDGVAGREPVVVGDVVVRDHLGGRLRRLVSDGRPVGSRAARSTVPAR